MNDQPPTPASAKRRDEESKVPEDAPRHDTREEMRAVVIEERARKKRRPLQIGAVVTGLLSAGGTAGYGVVHGDSIEVKQARTQQQLEDERSARLEADARHKEEIDQLYAQLEKESIARQAVATSVAVLKAQNKLMLRALHVDPKQWPKEETP
jgi:hypothetical protein